MKIPGLPRARYDECFSSWMYRTELRKTKLPAFHLFSPTTDPDLALDEAILSYLCGDNSIYRMHLIKYFEFSSRWLLDWDNRIAFCSECFRDDIAMGGMPYWRKAWCMLHSPICGTHLQLLSLYRTTFPEIDKAWVAFSIETEGPPYSGSYRNRSYPNSYPGTSRPMIRLAMRVQKLLNTALHNEIVWFQPLNQMLGSEWLLVFVDYLFEQFLFPRTGFCPSGGLSRGHQRGLPRDRSTSWQEAAQAANQERDPYARVVSLILIGRVLSMISDSEINHVIDEMNLHYMMYYSCTPKNIARDGVVTFGKTEKMLIEQVLTYAPPAFSELIAGFTSNLRWHR